MEYVLFSVSESYFTRYLSKNRERSGLSNLFFPARRPTITSYRKICLANGNFGWQMTNRYALPNRAPKQKTCCLPCRWQEYHILRTLYCVILFLRLKCGHAVSPRPVFRQLDLISLSVFSQSIIERETDAPSVFRTFNTS